VDRLCSSWQEQYTFALRITPPEPGSAPLETTFSFGTPSHILRPGASGSYFYPEETPLIYANLNVSRDSLPDLARCDIVIRRGSADATGIPITDFASVLAPQTAPNFIDTSRLIRFSPTSAEGATIHPWSEPVRDHAVTFELFRNAAGGLVLIDQTEPLRFGFISHFPKPTFPSRIESTSIDARGFISINGTPYFPVFWTPHFGMSPEADYPPMQFGFKALDLTSLVYSKNRMPDDEFRAKILAKVAEVKDDPAFFQYELGEGEMQLQDDAWKERLAWLKTAIGWIRAADPRHIINGPISWLVGHPGHNEAMQAFVPDWDVIGVEASFETVPDIARFAMPLMKERRTAVLVGLETYFYQSERTLRWRGYRSVLAGAAGIGLCPSGMLQSRPDKVNYLRGLNGEFRGLAPIILSAEPGDQAQIDSERILSMEKLYEGKRYILTVRDGIEGPRIHARFSVPRTFPCRSVRVLFEGRAIQPTDGAFEDCFADRHDVHVYELSP